MIGIVIVSHSAKLAEGVVELARTMGGEEVRIQAAGGLDLPEPTLGTDPMRIQRAIQKVYSEEGVLVLMDLGSAILSAEMAVEMLLEEQQKNILVCDAPLVEGAIAAAVQARIGSSLQEVAAEARTALSAKIEHLNTSDMPLLKTLIGTKAPQLTKAQEIKLTVHNALGLHARPAARLVKAAALFSDTDIQIKNLTTGHGPVNAKSINAVFTLSVLHGHEILVRASGPNAEQALNNILVLAEDDFGDTVETTAMMQSKLTSSVASTNVTPSYKGLAASSGIVMGKIIQFHSAVLQKIPTYSISAPTDEWNLLQESIAKTSEEIRNDLSAAKTRISQQTAEIFEAHLLFLEDEEILDPARKAIFVNKINAAAAWQQSIDQMAARYQQTDDDYLRARVQDIMDVGQQVLRHIVGEEYIALDLPEPVILFARDLSPAETSRLDTTKVLGICTAQGGGTSHTAILARGMGIPAITGLGEEILQLPNDSSVILDGYSGELFVNPLPAIRQEFEQKAISILEAQKVANLECHLPAITNDQHVVEVVANIDSIAGAKAAVNVGAEGVGLFRTEFLFLQRSNAPTEEEQYLVYFEAAKALNGKPMIIRTLDAGGDKFLPYLNLAHEENPFLGWRAIRLCLAEPELFLTQLRAIVRVAASYPVKIMFPMIATLQEWRAAKSFLQEAINEVEQVHHLTIANIETGIMVEIPAAAIQANQFAKEVDFFSIGTNDLTQYTMAAERGNAKIAALNDPFHPAVLQLIQGVVQAAHDHGKWVGVCGEMAGDPLAIPLLIGLHVDELSMSAPSIAAAKQIIRSMNYSEAVELAAKVLSMESAKEIRNAFM